MYNLKTFVKENTWLPRSSHMDFGWGNGYVIIPEGHPLNGVHYNSLYDVINVHGGLTFSENGKNTRKNFKMGDDEIKDSDWVVGFDTAHSGDSLSKWGKERVERETYRLKRQIEKHTTSIK